MRGGVAAPAPLTLENGPHSVPHLVTSPLSSRVPPSVFVDLALSNTELVLHPASMRVEAFVPFVSFVVLENHLANIYLGHLSKGYAG